MKVITDKLLAFFIPEGIYENIFVEIEHPNFGKINFNDYYKIIGTINKSGQFDFDCEKYVTYLNNGYRIYNEVSYNRADYTNENSTLTKEESFISLLNSKGIFLENLNNQKILILQKI